jgi:hypothetical protein
MNKKTELIIQNIIEYMKDINVSDENSFEKFYEQGTYDTDKHVYDFVWTIYLANK